MKKVQPEKSATARKCNMKQQEKKNTKKVQREKSAPPEKCNTKKGAQ